MVSFRACVGAKEWGMRMGANRRNVKPTNLGQCPLSQKGKKAMADE